MVRNQRLTTHIKNINKNKLKTKEEIIGYCSATNVSETMEERILKYFSIIA